jgi:hypothetical protein
LEQAFWGLIGAIIGGILAILGNLMLEHRREYKNRERSLRALLAETEFNLQLLGGIKGGELPYTSLESLLETAAYEQARDNGDLTHLPEDVSMEIASARFELMVCCDIARRNPSLRFPEESSSGEGYNFEHYRGDAHARLLNVKGILRSRFNRRTGVFGYLCKKTD